MGYKVKRGSTFTSNMKEALQRFLKRLVTMVIIFGLVAAVGYFLLQYAYDNYPPFASAASQIIDWMKAFYAEYGLWATVGLIAVFFVVIWALDEEANRKGRQSLSK